VSLLQLLDQGLHIGRDCFFRGLLRLRLVGVMGGRVDGVCGVMAALLIGGSPLLLLLNWGSVVANNYALAQAHACGGSNCKGRESPRACNGAQREWKAPWSAQTQRSAVRKTGETPCGRERAEPLSVLRTCITKQTKDMRYSEAER